MASNIWIRLRNKLTGATVGPFTAHKGLRFSKKADGGYNWLEAVLFNTSGLSADRDKYDRIWVGEGEDTVENRYWYGMVENMIETPGGLYIRGIGLMSLLSSLTYRRIFSEMDYTRWVERTKARHPQGNSEHFSGGAGYVFEYGGQEVPSLYFECPKGAKVVEGDNFAFVLTANPGEVFKRIRFNARVYTMDNFFTLALYPGTDNIFDTSNIIFQLTNTSKDAMGTVESLGNDISLSGAKSTNQLLFKFVIPTSSSGRGNRPDGTSSHHAARVWDLEVKCHADDVTEQGALTDLINTLLPGCATNIGDPGTVLKPFSIRERNYGADAIAQINQYALWRPGFFSPQERFDYVQADYSTVAYRAKAGKDVEVNVDESISNYRNRIIVEYVNEWGEVAEAVVQDLSTSSKLINELGYVRELIHPTALEMTSTQAAELAGKLLEENMRQKVTTSDRIPLRIVYDTIQNQVKLGKVEPGKVLELTDRTYRGDNLKGYISEVEYEHDSQTLHVAFDDDDKSPEVLLAKLALSKVM